MKTRAEFKKFLEALADSENRIADAVAEVIGSDYDRKFQTPEESLEFTIERLRAALPTHDNPDMVQALIGMHVELLGLGRVFA